jgi:hypothetical protein
VIQDAAPDEPADPRLHARLSAGAGAVLGIAIALLLALLPGGGVHAARLQSGISATSADHHLTPAADRTGEARRSLHKAKRPDPRRADFDGGLASLQQPSEFGGIAPAAPLRAAQAPAQRPTRWPSTAQARAPPRA